MCNKECCRLYGVSVVHDLTIALADDPHTTGYVLKPLKELRVVRLQAVVVAERSSWNKIRHRLHCNSNNTEVTYKTAQTSKIHDATVLALNFNHKFSR